MQITQSQARRKIYKYWQIEFCGSKTALNLIFSITTEHSTSLT